MNLRLIPLVSVAAVAACSWMSNPTIRDVDVDNLSPNQSLLILSTAADETCVVAAVTLIIREVRDAGERSSDVAFVQLNNRFSRSQFPNDHAGVVTVVLPPGRYELALDSVNPTMTNDASKAYDAVPTQDSIAVSHPFPLAPGAITYLGEIRSNGCGSITLRVSDRRDRDIPAVAQLEPRLTSRPIGYQPAELLQ